MQTAVGAFAVYFAAAHPFELVGDAADPLALDYFPIRVLADVRLCHQPLFEQFVDCLIELDQFQVRQPGGLTRNLM